MSSDSATRDIANPAVSRATADRARTDVKLEFPVLNIRVRGCWLAALWLAGGCGSLPASSTTTLAVPGRANANVSMTAEGEFVAAAWSAAEPGGSMDIYLSVSADGGKRFVAPVRVNATPGEARVNGEQPPRIALVPRDGAPPSIVVVWTAKGTAGTVLLGSRSDDAGRTFSASTLVPGTDAPGNRGWHAVGTDAAGNVHVVWLDHRRLASDSKAESTHRHGAMGESGSDTAGMAQFSDLYSAMLDHPASPAPLTAGVCYCCKTAIAPGPGGAMHLAWRHVYPGNLRDIAFTTLMAAGVTGTPVRVSEDRWMLQGCPDDGPAMDVDGSGRVHVVWPTVVENDGAGQKVLFHASSADGRTFTARTRLPVEGQANHPQIAVARDGTLVLAWDEVHGAERRIVVATSSDAGLSAVPAFRRDQSTGDQSGVYPAIALTPTHSIVAWTSGAPAESTIRVLRLPAVH